MNTLCCGTSVYRNHCEEEDCDRDAWMWCCDGQLRSAKFDVNTHCCGTSIYNTGSQRCCDGAVHPTGADIECCGSLAYNLTMSICCYPDQVKDRTHFPSAGCCGTEVYDMETHLCCDGVLVYQEFGYSSGCCGTSVINSEKFLCCNHTLYPRLGEGQWCCGTKVCDDQTQLCCGGVVVYKEFGSSSACCETSVIDFEEFWPNAEAHRKLGQMCCDGVAINITSYDDRCCGTRVYNIETETCCDEYLSDSAHDPHRSGPKVWMSRNFQPTSAAGLSNLGSTVMAVTELLTLAALAGC